MAIKQLNGQTGSKVGSRVVGFANRVFFGADERGSSGVRAEMRRARVGVPEKGIHRGEREGESVNDVYLFCLISVLCFFLLLLAMLPRIPHVRGIEILTSHVFLDKHNLKRSVHFQQWITTDYSGFTVDGCPTSYQERVGSFFLPISRGVLEDVQ